MQVERMVSVIQVVDDHFDDRDVVDGRHQLRAPEVVRPRRCRVPQVAEQTRRVHQRLPRLIHTRVRGSAPVRRRRGMGGRTVSLMKARYRDVDSSSPAGYSMAIVKYTVLRVPQCMRRGSGERYTYNVGSGTDTWVTGTRSPSSNSPGEPLGSAGGLSSRATSGIVSASTPYRMTPRTSVWHPGLSY